MNVGDVLVEGACAGIRNRHTAEDPCWALPGSCLAFLASRESKLGCEQLDVESWEMVVLGFGKEPPSGCHPSHRGLALGFGCTGCSQEDIPSAGDYTEE